MKRGNFRDQSQPSDEAERATALDPTRSLIVQAPAGSGKTEVLVRRFLRLLATVDQPEEIVAITFTRKAAAEMRARVVAALYLAEEDQPADDYRRDLWQVARLARARDRAKQWSLVTRPSRLTIQTIDSFSAGLCAQTPLASGVSPRSEVIDDASELRSLAAVRTLDLVEGADTARLTAALVRLYGHFDGQWDRLERLIADQLARRDQWMPLLVPRRLDRELRDHCEGALRRVIQRHLRACCDHTPHEVAGRLPALAAFAAENLIGARTGGRQPSEPNDLQHPDRGIPRLRGCTKMPGSEIDALTQWQDFADLLLTKSGQPRKRVTRSQGFPPRSAEKEAFEVLLFQLADHERFIRGLHETRALPDARYAEEEWQVLAALIEVLKVAVAQLHLIFAESGKVDFIQLAQGAERALGASGSPTDVALRLDRRIRHLLVDEYQDTSLSQLGLLEALLSGWEPDDGRTIFLVGDPMQSIYRFRQAEVGLFLRAQQSGVADRQLESIRLRENFRSREALVAWFNASFPQIFPEVDDLEQSAIAYRASVASPDLEANARLGNDAAAIVASHCSFDHDPRAEGEEIAKLIATRMAEPSHRPLSIAVLARTRAHLSETAAALARRAILFQAVDVTALGERPIVSDLVMLTRALIDRGDRTAWLALLRAPFCGVELADLLVIAERSQRGTVWAGLQDEALAREISERAATVCQRVVETLAPALHARRRRDLASWTEGVWYALGGAVGIGASEMSEARAFFSLLGAHSFGGTMADPLRLDRLVQELYAPSAAGADDAQVHLMTMHKAKGLEFDIVILPSLGARTRYGEAPLLHALEYIDEDGLDSLLLAPIRARHTSGSATYDYLEARERILDAHENIRLLYVAATRARRELHLFGHAALDSAGHPKPLHGSLLSSLWPVVRKEYEDKADLAQVPAVQVADRPQSLWRISADWEASEPPEEQFSSGSKARRDTGIVDVNPLPLGDEQGNKREISFDWARVIAAPVGTVVHRILEKIAHEGCSVWSTTKLETLDVPIRTSLRSLGLSGRDLEEGISRAQSALFNTLDDPRGRWLLSDAHQDAHCELALTFNDHGEPSQIIIDRTFIADDIRWIVDYKTGTHQGGHLEHFLDAEKERYRSQLEHYAEVFSQCEDRPIRLGLYFPIVRGWRTWDFRR